MRIIVSPAKKMNADPDGLPPREAPRFLERTQILLDWLRGLDLEGLRRLLACNGDIARLNYGRFRDMDLRRGFTPALFAYEGIQYRYMAPNVFTAGELAYVQEHLRILSGFYGLLRPFDAVVPYRLEMQAKLKTPFCASLYDFWGDSLARALAEEDGVVLNLASEEYARAIRPHLPGGVRLITPVFGEEAGGRVVEKGVYVKMARGEMVRYLAGRGARGPEEAKGFNGLGYAFRPELSGEERYVFLREKPGRAV